MTGSIKRLLVTIAAFALLAVALAPAGFAGGDDDDDDDGAAAGGVQTGGGGMVASMSPEGSLVVPLALAGGGLVLLTFGAGTLRRRAGER